MNFNVAYHRPSFGIFSNRNHCVGKEVSTLGLVSQVLAPGYKALGRPDQMEEDGALGLTPPPTPHLTSPHPTPPAEPEVNVSSKLHSVVPEEEITSCAEMFCL